jgi:hypothetical protein
MVTNAIGLVGTQVADAETARAASLAASQTHDYTSRFELPCPLVQASPDSRLTTCLKSTSRCHPTRNAVTTNTINMAIFSMANKMPYTAGDQHAEMHTSDIERLSQSTSSVAPWILVSP